MANRPYQANQAPRPGEQAAEDERRYRRLLQALARAGLGEQRAAEAASAVLCALEQRLSGGEARDLDEELPWALRDLVRRCQQHPRARPQGTGRDEFVARVAGELELEPLQAERVVRDVFSAVRDLLSEQESSDVAGQLPADLRALWAPPS
jgi:uncharacterized protein (DUF2267 family)